MHLGPCAHPPTSPGLALRLEEGRSSSSLGGKQGEESESEDVYICLLRVLIDMEERGLTSPVLNLLGKYFDR
jgi:hypothetical protein